MFQTSWCGRCNAARDAIRSVLPQERIKLIDCEKESIVCANLGIESYPSFGYVEKGHMTKHFNYRY